MRMLAVTADIRPIALTAVLGALIALGTLYENSPPELLDAFAVRGGASETESARSIPADWPICSAVAAAGAAADWAERDPDFSAGKTALAKGAWTTAITALRFAAVRDPRNADIQNYLGYAYWRAGDLGPAMGSFQHALLINPRHRGAHEHLGELYLALNEPARSDEHLAALKQICLIPCEEFDSLQQAIAATRGSLTR